MNFMISLKWNLNFKEHGCQMWQFPFHTCRKRNHHKQHWSASQTVNTAHRLQRRILGMTSCQASFRLELSVRMSDAKCQCQKALCLACPCWQVRKWSMLPDQHKRIAALRCCSSHICGPTINNFSCLQSPWV